jgi:hypothetical protein
MVDQPIADRETARLRIFRRTALPGWANLVAVVGVVTIALWQLHPSLLLADTTTAGGDTGAHVALPAFMISHLLPHGQLTGWDPEWYDGFPLYTFYFPLPGVITAAFNLVLNYNVAFKMATILGTVTLPGAAWAFGRLAGLRDPGPGCLAAATLPFLFEPSFTIDGGNLLSTMAGEFSYSLGISLALVFLGVVALGLRTGRHRVLAAVLLAATLLCHLITAIFAVAGAVMWVVLDVDLLHAVGAGLRGRLARRSWSRRFWWAAVSGAIGIGLAGWWLVPFVIRQPYTTNMGWTNVEGFPHLLFPGSARWVLAADLVGLIAMVLRRNRVALFIAAMGGVSAAVVCLDPQGKLYNVRFLPLWFLCLYLLAGLAVSEVVSAVHRHLRRRRLARWVWSLSARPAGAGSYRRPTPGPSAAGAAVGPLIALAAACLAVVPPLVLPASALSDVGVTVGADQPSAWATWNYSGYQGKPDYPEYQAVIDMMARVGADQGCGRAMWEYDASENRFGTPEALMLLPYWTNDCIDSMEGLLFESSSTTPFHFIDQSELSVNPSDAVVGLPYTGLDVALGIQHLQIMGVRYFVAASTTVEQAAAADPAVTEVASTGPWRTVYNGQTLDTTWVVYEVSHSSLVTPLANQPVVWKGVGEGQTDWLPPALAWYDDPARWGVLAAASGPPDWTRVAIGDAHPPQQAEPTTTVDDVSQTDDTVHFHVSRVGVPVEVKVSYFPNWQATGAEGPYRVAPNLMVVVPTSHDVTLHYGTTVVDEVGWWITGLSVVASLALGGLALRRRRGRGRPRAEMGEVERDPLSGGQDPA